MNIAIHVSSRPVGEAMHRFLVAKGYDSVVMSERSPANGFTPHVLLVDSTTLTQKLLSRYPLAEVLLLDTRLVEKKLVATSPTGL